MEEFGDSPFWVPNWADMLREDLDRSKNVSLRVRLNPESTFSVAGRCMEDGQFLYDYSPSS